MLANRGGALVSQLAVGAFLSPETVGIWAVALAITTISLFFQANDFSRIPLQGTCPEEVIAIDETLNRWLMVSWIIVASLIAILMPSFAGKSYAPLLALLALCPLRIQASRFVTRLSTSGNMKRISWCTAAEGLVRTLVLVSALFLGAGLWSFVLVEWAAVTTQLIMVWPESNNQIPKKSTLWRLPSPIITKICTTSLVCLLVASEGHVVSILLAKAASESAAGSYFFSLRFANQINMILYPLMILESLPTLIKNRTDPSRFTSEVRRLLRRYWILALTMGTVIAVIGPIGLRVVWGNRWMEAANMLHILGFSMAIRAMYVFAKVQLEAVGSFNLILALSVFDLTMISSILIVAGLNHFSPIMIVGILGLESLLILICAQILARRNHPLAG